LLGTFTLERPYYYCPACHRGFYPCDEALGIEAMRYTPAAHEVICLAGVQDSFSKAADTLFVLSGLRVSESTVQRVTEAEGAALGEMLANKETIGKDEPWDWSHDARGHTVAYVSVDATGVPQQGPHGEKTESKMAYVAMIYNARDAAETKERKPERIERNRRYLAGYFELDELGLQLRRQAAQVGIDAVQQQVALSDGGNGLEDFFRKNFSRAEIILDFWHAKEYLVELGQTLFGEGSQDGKQWLDEQCHRLKHAGGEAVLAELQKIDGSNRGASVQEKLRITLGYFENHKHKMDYPRYLANGWQIGSGQVESACNTVLNLRLSGSGRRWCFAKSDGICHLRALYCGEPTQWKQYWHPSQASTYQEN
jgi:hypothetical protein